MDMYDLIAHYASGTLFSIAIWALMGAFFDKRKTPIWAVMFSILLFASAPILVGLLVPITTFMLIAISAVTLLVVTLNYESTIVRKVLAVILSLLFIAMSNLVGMFIVPTFEAYTAQHLLARGALPLFVALLLRRGSHLKRQNIPPTILWVYTVFSFVIVAFFITFFMLIHLSPDLPPILLTTALGLGLLICVLVYTLYTVMAKSYDNKLKSALHSQEKEHYLAQAMLMQESTNKIRSIHHDMKSHFVTLRDYTMGNQVATDYLNNLLNDMGEHEALSRTGNIAIDSIINYKLRDINEAGISLALKVAVPPQLAIDASDITVILGNLLDNAMEALAKVQEDKKLVINIKLEGSCVYIKVENTFDGNVKYAGKGSGGQITTIKTGDGHGYGLKNIQQAVEKYNGHAKFVHEGNLFSAVVFLYT